MIYWVFFFFYIPNVGRIVFVVLRFMLLLVDGVFLYLLFTLIVYCGLKFGVGVVGYYEQVARLALTESVDLVVIVMATVEVPVVRVVTSVATRVELRQTTGLPLG